MTPKYEIFELKMPGPSAGNPFVDVDLTADFAFEGETRTVLGFYDGDGTYIVRYMPDKEGRWSYVTHSSAPELDGQSGEFDCGPAFEGNHGPVRVYDKFFFAHDDGTPFYPFGTTIYNWVNQPMDMVHQTIDTLSKNCFNKVRMGTFPKAFSYNYDDPEMYPYEGGRNPDAPETSPHDMMAMMMGNASDYTFDFTRFNPTWWHHFEWCVNEMKRLGIEVDLIVFHPYDKWGFSRMNMEENLRYVRYLTARMSSFSNVWWSMANEWDVIMTKSVEDWDALALEIKKWDATDKLCSIHNCMKEFDLTRDWITHVSFQRIDYYSHVELTAKMREKWGKPVIFDEIVYEGNIDAGWGNITAEELTRRFWEVVVRGGYCTHGETYYREDEKLWWAKGGELTGESPVRIAFLKSIVEDMGYITCFAEGMDWDVVWGYAGEIFTVKAMTPFGEMEKRFSTDMICYFSYSRPLFRDFTLPENMKYEVDIIDTWDMTITTLPGIYSGQTKVNLPGKCYVAVRFRAVKE